MEFLPESWCLVKEFLGVYHIGTDWVFVDHLPTEKVRMFCYVHHLPVDDLYGLKKYKSKDLWSQLYFFGIEVAFSFNESDLKRFKFYNMVRITLWTGKCMNGCIGYIGRGVVTLKTADDMTNVPFDEIKSMTKRYLTLREKSIELGL